MINSIKMSLWSPILSSEEKLFRKNLINKLLEESKIFNSMMVMKTAMLVIGLKEALAEVK